MFAFSAGTRNLYRLLKNSKHKQQKYPLISIKLHRVPQQNESGANSGIDNKKIQIIKTYKGQSWRTARLSPIT